MIGQERAVRIKLVLMDVDGTMTDGSLFVLPDGEEIKAYHVRDGMGVLLAHQAGIKTGIITGKTSKSVERRAEKLRIGEVYQGILDKKKILNEIAARHKLQVEEIAYIGDDLGDLEVMKAVGLAGSPADAHPVIRKHSHWVSQYGGGKGAVREFIEFILEAQGIWDQIEEKVKRLFDFKL
jgi:3-deoxy-D-manno-octulosonate 8-phosphate phosphatase (KDO 8-P phosphatase)